MRNIGIMVNLARWYIVIFTLQPAAETQAMQNAEQNTDIHERKPSTELSAVRSESPHRSGSVDENGHVQQY